MSKVARVVGTIAAVVAIAASIAVTFGATAFLGVALTTIAAVASATSAVAMAIAQATMKPPDMRGSVSQVLIGNNLPVPYGMGRTYAGGMLVYDDSSGDNNRWRFQVMVTSGAGPIEEVEDILLDYNPATFDGSGDAVGWYGDFLDVQFRLGARPDTAFTAGGINPMPGWTSAHKLSGFSAYRVKMKFDKDGKRFASGVPQWGMLAKYVKVYDPRLDTTYPGGAGAHRWNDESTWAWSENPALHALAYARGRYIEKDSGGSPLTVPVKVVGVGLRDYPEAIRIDQFVELANICDANGWTLGGFVYEGPGLSKWDNLKRILQAAASEPVWTGGTLGLKISAPKTPLVTITRNDLTDGEISVQAMQSWRDKINTVVPRVRLETHKWEYVQLEAVEGSTYITEDGETKTKEVQFDLCQNEDQGAELAAYAVVNSREFGPITLPCKPYLMAFRPGEAVTVDLTPDLPEAFTAVIIGRQIDPSTGSVMLTLESETDAKHDFALGRTGVPPPTPTLVDPQVKDEAVGAPSAAAETQLIASSYVTGMTFTLSSAGALSVSAHTRVYLDKSVSVSASGTISTGADADDLVLVYYDDPDRAGGAVTYQYLIIDEGVGETTDAFAGDAHPYRHFVASKKVPASGSTGGGSGAGSGGGGTMPGGGGGLINYQ